MSYLGNADGPRESEILEKLGPIYFGCSPADLESDISFHNFAESKGEIVPVHVDEKGRPYIIFSSPDPGTTQIFVLEKHGYKLEGEIKTFSENESSLWKNRNNIGK